MKQRRPAPSEEPDGPVAPSSALEPPPDTGLPIAAPVATPPTTRRAAKVTVVPDLGGLAAAEASDALRTADLCPAIEPQPVEDAERVGKVVGQLPPAGAELARGDVVDVFVGRAAAEAAPEDDGWYEPAVEASTAPALAPAPTPVAATTAPDGATDPKTDPGAAAPRGARARKRRAGRPGIAFTPPASVRLLNESPSPVHEDGPEDLEPREPVRARPRVRRRVPRRARPGHGPRRAVVAICAMSLLGVATTVTATILGGGHTARPAGPIARTPAAAAPREIHTTAVPSRATPHAGQPARPEHPPHVAGIPRRPARSPNRQPRQARDAQRPTAQSHQADGERPSPTAHAQRTAPSRPPISPSPPPAVAVQPPAPQAVSPPPAVPSHAVSPSDACEACAEH